MTSSTLQGALRPRVEGYPDFSESLGELAVRLAARAGLILDPWQQDSLRIMMARRPDGKWICRHYCEWVPRQNGKGAIIEARALAAFLLLGDQEIVWSAHEFKTAHKEFTRLWRLFERLGTEVKRGDPTELNIPTGTGTIRVKVTQGNDNKGFKRLDTGATILFVARSKRSGRGFSGDLIVLDEAFSLTPEDQDAMQPTMRARPRAQVVYVSTPPLTGDTGEIMYEMRVRAEDGDFERLGYRDWGLAGDLDHLEDVDLDDRELWAASNPALDIRLDEEDVLDDRKTMRAFGGRGFARECLGIWPAARTVAGGVIDPVRWEKLQDPDARRTGDVALGVNIAPARDYASIALFGQGVDGKGNAAGYAQLIVRKAGTQWIVPMLAQLRRELDPVVVAMNAATLKSLRPTLADAEFVLPDSPDDRKRGDLVEISASDGAAACGHLIDAVRDLTFRVRPDAEHPEVLDDAALAAKTRRVGDAIAWSSKGDEAEISPVEAITAGQYGWVTYRPVEKPPPAPPLVLSDGSGDGDSDDLMNTGF